MLKIIEEHLELEDNNNESKSVQGPKVTSPTPPAPPSTLPPAPTTTEINTEPPTTTTINKIEQCLTHMSTDDEVASAVSGATGVQILVKKISIVQYKDIAGSEEKAKKKNQEVVLNFQNKDIEPAGFGGVSSYFSNIGRCD